MIGITLILSGAGKLVTLSPKAARHRRGAA
jgi:hypothetical protein